MRPPGKYVQNRMTQREITEAEIDLAVSQPEAQYPAKTHSDRTVILGRTSFGGCLKVVVFTHEPASVITVAEHINQESPNNWTSSPSKFAEHDLTTDSTYVQLSEAPVAGTLLHISDVIMVDVDEYGTPAGVEIVAPLDTIEPDEWYALARIVPEVKQIFEEYFPL
jgi:uncharacterized protein YuzE